MKILFDHCVPKKLRRLLRPLTIKTTREMGWEELKNGRLLREAEQIFDVMLTTDTNIAYQQHLPNYDIALIVLHSLSNKTEALSELIPDILAALPTIQSGTAIKLATTVYIKRKGMP
jgi:hypothetical protein